MLGMIILRYIKEVIRPSRIFFIQRKNLSALLDSRKEIAGTPQQRTEYFISILSCKRCVDYKLNNAEHVKPRNPFFRASLDFE